MMNSIELFAGAGGLGLGIAKAGFKHKIVVEWDKDACNTIRENFGAKTENTHKWPLFEGDVRQYDFRHLRGGKSILYLADPLVSHFLSAENIADTKMGGICSQRPHELYGPLNRRRLFSKMSKDYLGNRSPNIFSIFFFS